MTTWYTADLHLGHAKIIDYCGRPWPDVDAMNAAIVNRWNETVAPTDTVYVLGDVAMNSHALDLAAGLAGRLVLVAGNHDGCWAGHSRGARQIDRYRAVGFGEIHTAGYLRDHQLASDVRVNLAHLPYDGDHTAEDRYADRRLTDDGTPLLCGHVHEAWKVRRSHAGSVQINVGVDVWDYRPVAEDVLLGLLDELMTEPAT